jgi:hypothetical protein
MATKTIGQIDTVSSLSSADYFEIESGGVSYKALLSQLAAFATPCGTLLDIGYQKTISSSFPAVALWDSDKTISTANYPILVPDLRASPASVTLTAGTVVTSVNVNMTSGSVITSVDSAFTIILNALTEEYAIQGAYSICVTIGGTDYTITSVSTVIGISGTIATGATTMTVYPHRIVGSTTTAKIFKDSGRALMSHDGKLRIAGTRRRHHYQGHFHAAYSFSSGGGNTVLASVSTGNALSTEAGAQVRESKTDSVNGTPITGPETEPNSSGVYRYMWAQVYVP